MGAANWSFWCWLLETMRGLKFSRRLNAPKASALTELRFGRCLMTCFFSSYSSNMQTRYSFGEGVAVRVGAGARLLLVRNYNRFSLYLVVALLGCDAG